MSNVVLRDYQERQLDFIRDIIPTTNTLGIQSGTGSGKSITFLSYAKEYLNENPDKNVIISTGFNHLVFQLEETAKFIGFEENKIKILIGKKVCNCPIEAEENGIPSNKFKLFTRNSEYNCGNKHYRLNIDDKKECPFTFQSYIEYFQNINSQTGQIIITNHSSLLLQYDKIPNVGIIIIDEAHTFGNFYDNFVSLELDKDDLTILDKAINQVKEPIRSIIKMNMNNNSRLPKKQIDAICDAKILENNIDLQNRIYEFFTTEPSIANYIEMNNYYYKINKFYHNFELNFSKDVKIILFSATLDKYTLQMFQCKKQHIYIEHKIFCKYENSEFLSIHNDENSSFKDNLNIFLKYLLYCKNDKNINSGLILSTTITDMEEAIKILSKNPIFKIYSIYDDNALDYFKKYNAKRYSKIKVLIGSRGLFQGIDIPDIDFVVLNKIPFPNYDEKNQALQKFLTNDGKSNYNFWENYTIPKVCNDIIQSTGRLWRSTDSKGIVSILDPRLSKRFKYLISMTMDKYRHGINIKELNKE